MTREELGQKYLKLMLEDPEIKNYSNLIENKDAIIQSYLRDEAQAAHNHQSREPALNALEQAEQDIAYAPILLRSRFIELLPEMVTKLYEELCQNGLALTVADKVHVQDIEHHSETAYLHRTSASATLSEAANLIVSRKSPVINKIFECDRTQGDLNAIIASVKINNVYSDPEDVRSAALLEPKTHLGIDIKQWVYETDNSKSYLPITSIEFSAEQVQRVVDATKIAQQQDRPFLSFSPQKRDGFIIAPEEFTMDKEQIIIQNSAYIPGYKALIEMNKSCWELLSNPGEFNHSQQLYNKVKHTLDKFFNIAMPPSQQERENQTRVNAVLQQLELHAGSDGIIEHNIQSMRAIMPEESPDIQDMLNAQQIFNEILDEHAQQPNRFNTVDDIIQAIDDKHQDHYIHYVNSVISNIRTAQQEYDRRSQVQTR